MNEIARLHREAMTLADKAGVERRNGHPDRSLELTRKAFELERDAAQGTEDRAELEPTRSVLHRSAASLALECGESREAERLIARALAGNPPEEIAEELRDLLEDVYFQRHLSLRGITLQPDEFQISLEGQAVGFGIVPTSFFFPRVHDIETVVYRTAERKMGLKFRERGARSKEVAEAIQTYVTGLRAASFAVTFRIAGPQRSLPGMDLPRVVIDDLFDCFELFEARDLQKLEEHFQDESYFRNFVGLTEKIAPDGKNISRVGFTATTPQGERRVALSRKRERIWVGAIEPVRAEPDQPFELSGVLLEADAKSSSRGVIQVVDDAGKSHRFVVPRGIMSDIVKPMFEERVTVTAQRKGRGFLLESIHPVDDESIE
ncbi:MAG TPA: hypothetical protein VM163_01275 [bacterium]|nr:hypothetical protein [bacterium]